MEVKVCRGCKKIFQYIAGPELCPKCRQLEEEMFQKVKEYLIEHPGANMYEVTQKTDVSAALIEKFLRQGRLQVAEDSPIVLTCERCGRKIMTGKYCNECKNQISSELNDVRKSIVEKNAPKDNSKARMRFLESNKLSH